MPENPVSYGQIEDKFRTYAAPRYSQSQIEAMLETIGQLEELTSVRPLMDLLREPARP